MSGDAQVGFIGLGLIGGSIAKAIKLKFPNYHIVAFDTNSLALSLAKSEGTIDFVADEVDNSFKLCDYIFLCAPVAYNVSYLSILKTIIKPDCILTDVGSVKTNIHEAVVSLSLENNFIGGHPMTGSEKTGFENAIPHLCENAYYILTPSKTVNTDNINKYKALVTAIGAIPIVLDYKEHDFITGAISHLPHIIASSLVNLVKTKDNDLETMKNIAAGGFKDITRIASSSPTMWQQICLTNKSNISLLLSDYINQLSQIKDCIDKSKTDELYSFFSDAREYRNSIPNSSLGPIKKIYEIYCDIIDEAGSIATLATILASNNISIKNIGIIHNREFEDGALRIEFYNDDCLKRALNLLSKYRYTVYER